MDTMQRDGKFFYLSHPPLAYYIPYGVFRILNIHPGILALQVLNLAFEFITIIFIYLITALLLKCDVQKSVCSSAIIASAIYLFLPVTLWFHSNAYMSDMFVQNTWAPALFIAMKIFLERKKNSAGWLIVFGLSLFLMIYTDWLGVLFAGSVVIACLIYAWKKQEQSFLTPAALSIIICFLTVTLVIYQYSSIAGWNTLMYCFSNRYSERGSLNWSSAANLVSSLNEVGFNYAASYLPVLILVFFLWLRRRSWFAEFPEFKIFAILSFVPVLLDHLLFIRYAGQDFSVLKASFFLSITSALMISSAMKTATNQSKVIVTTIICMAGLVIYFFINRPGENSLNGDRYATEMNIGKFINEHTDTNEVVFAKDFEVSPQIVFYAHRNIKEVNSEKQAVNFLNSHPIKQGVIFQMDSSRELSMQRLSVP
jgi:hypothetical protein